MQRSNSPSASPQERVDVKPADEHHHHRDHVDDIGDAAPDSRHDGDGDVYKNEQPKEPPLEVWHIKCSDTGCNDTGNVLRGCCLPCPYYVHQRQHMLTLEGKEYKCCSSTDAKCCEPCQKLSQQHPVACLYLWACCCTTCFLHNNRAMIKKRYKLETEDWEKCMGCCVLSVFIVCIVIAAVGGGGGSSGNNCKIDDFLPVLLWLVCGCAYAQHEGEVALRESGAAPPPHAAAQSMQ